MKGFILVEDVNIYHKGILVKPCESNNLFLKLWYLLFPRGWKTKEEAMKAKKEVEDNYGSKWKILALAREKIK